MAWLPSGPVYIFSPPLGFSPGAIRAQMGSPKALQKGSQIDAKMGGEKEEQLASYSPLIPFTPPPHVLVFIMKVVVFLVQPPKIYSSLNHLFGGHVGPHCPLPFGPLWGCKKWSGPKGRFAGHRPIPLWAGTGFERNCFCRTPASW